jgi:hypothetical protein
LAAGFLPAFAPATGPFYPNICALNHTESDLKFETGPHAIILYSQLLRARRTVSTNVLSASMTAFGPAKFA